MYRHPWADKICYQIYPKSFCDSNGDGIGDLPGIISRLDYIRSLGVDLIWLSPVYRSPFKDQGYDIADYYDIDPIFGTMDDMKRLIAEARRRGMGILMDLVINHCSDQHPWFQACIKDPHGPYGDYFYLSPPHRENNLRSYFGGSCWSELPGHPELKYFHAFHSSQPDLNWENPKLREALIQMINWWLELGLSGFRIDAIMNIKKVLPFHDYPADRDDGRAGVPRMIREAEARCGGVHAFLRELNERCFKPHGAFTVGEVFDADGDKLARFIGREGYFSSMFDFEEAVIGRSPNGWYETVQRIQPEDYKAAVFRAQRRAGVDCCYANIIENHDEPRGVSHYLSPDAEASPYGKKLLACMYYLLRGIPFIYQGQELGMENMPFENIAQIDDIGTLDQYGHALSHGLSEAEAMQLVRAFSRDNARTPMQWSDAPQAGFSTSAPWMALNPNYRRLNAAAQEAEPDSLLHFYRRLAGLRKREGLSELFAHGALLPVLEQVQNLMAYLRLPAAGDAAHAGASQDAGQPIASSTELRGSVLVLGNFQATPLTPFGQDEILDRALICALQDPQSVLLNNYQDIQLLTHKRQLAPWQAVVIRL